MEDMICDRGKLAAWLLSVAHKMATHVDRTNPYGDTQPARRHGACPRSSPERTRFDLRVLTVAFQQGCCTISIDCF
jgi:hypothetical protein